MSRVFVHGQGAVSPAGWGLSALQAGLAKGRSLPVQEMARPGWEKPLPVRLVPQPSPRPAFLAHPRLRRASPVAQHSVGAALEALGEERPAHQFRRVAVWDHRMHHDWRHFVFQAILPGSHPGPGDGESNGFF